VTSRRELWFVAPLRVEIRPGREPVALEPGQLRARAVASGVSQGTELLLYRGEGPKPFDPSLDLPGTPTYPRRYGYAWIADVVESRADGVPVGGRIFALAPHGDEHVLDASRVRLVPHALPAARATLAANLETAVTAIWDAELELGDEVVVLGGGIVGLLCGWLARRGGARRVRLVEPSPKRRAAALALGFDEAISPEQDDPRGDQDVVIEATGHPAALDRAISHAGRDAAVVVVSFYGERKAAVSLGSEFHRRRVALKASQVSHIAPRKTARWTYERRFSLVLDLLGDPRLDALVEPPIPFGEAPAAYGKLAGDPAATLQTVFFYADGG
jgi:2-desacetyl-2-hydroxyethyl bacteriochlorophyllide A dehydrogenase